MAKVKKCLDSGCTEYILLDDNTVIIQPKEKCDVKSIPEDFQKQFSEIASHVNETIYTSKHRFKKIKVGEELRF